MMVVAFAMLVTFLLMLVGGDGVVGVLVPVAALRSSCRSSWNRRAGTGTGTAVLLRPSRHHRHPRQLLSVAKTNYEAPEIKNDNDSDNDIGCLGDTNHTVLHGLGWHAHFAAQFLRQQSAVPDSSVASSSSSSAFQLLPVRVLEVRSKTIVGVGPRFSTTTADEDEDTLLQDYFIPITPNSVDNTGNTKIINDNNVQGIVAGDWITVQVPQPPSQHHDRQLERENENQDVVAAAPPILRSILQRRSWLHRRAPGRNIRKTQLLAANVNTVCIVSSCNQEFNVARLERYVATVLAADNTVQPVIVLTKKDQLLVDVVDGNQDSADPNYAMLDYAEIAAAAHEYELADFLRSSTVHTIRLAVGKARRKQLHRFLEDDLPDSRRTLHHKSEGTEPTRVFVVTKLALQLDDDAEDLDPEWLLNYYLEAAASIGTAMRREETTTQTTMTAAVTTIPVICLDATNTTEVRSMFGPYLGAGQTLAFVGSSGVGKSTLVNTLCCRNRRNSNGEENAAADRVAVTGDIHTDSGQGRHTTTRRQLYYIPTFNHEEDAEDAAGNKYLPNQGAIIDTPGLRELQLVDTAVGIERLFPELVALGGQCRFRDCVHDTTTPGCALQAALDDGRVEADRVARYFKLIAEDQTNSDDIAAGTQERERKHQRKQYTTKNTSRTNTHPKGRRKDPKSSRNSTNKKKLKYK